MKRIICAAVCAVSALFFHVSVAVAQTGGSTTGISQGNGSSLVGIPLTRSDPRNINQPGISDSNIASLALDVPIECVVDGDYDSDGDIDEADYMIYRRTRDLPTAANADDLTIGNDDELGLFDRSGFMLDRREKLFCDPDELPQHPLPPAPHIVLGGALGGNIPLGNPPFGPTQFVIPSTNLAGRLYAELFWPHKFGPRTHFALGFAGIYGSTSPHFVGNYGSTAVVAVGGLDSHWGGVIYAAAEHSIAPRINARILLGAGVGQRTLNLTTGGVTVAQGSGTVLLLQGGVEVFRRLNDNVDVGLGVFATRAGGINTNVGGMNRTVGPAWSAKVLAELRFNFSQLVD